MTPTFHGSMRKLLTVEREAQVIAQLRSPHTVTLFETFRRLVPPLGSADWFWD